MTKKLVVALLVALPLHMAAQIQKRPISTEYPYPEAFKTPQVAPEIPFETPNLDYWTGMPLDQNFGEVSDVAHNSAGHVFILSRSAANGSLHGGRATQVFEFDQNGKWVREIGRPNLYSFGYAHGVTVDKNQDIWVTDKGTDMVTKFNGRTGRVMMVLGRREELTSSYWLPRRAGGPAPGANPEEGGFGEPTDTTWDSKGNIYVADGYVNKRVAKFDADGNWIGTWGKQGTGPGEFGLPHNIVTDKNDRIWVGDRPNARLQVFDTEGKWLKDVIINVKTPPQQPVMGHQYPPTMTANPLAPGNYRPGAPDGMCIPDNNKDVMFVADLYPGRVYKINLEGKVLGYFAGVGKKAGQTGATHGLSCPTENLVYTAEFENWRVQRFVLKTTPANTTAAK